jgi:hypothetical protein
MTLPQLFVQLAPLLSCYLTQTITPQEFCIDSQFIPLLSQEFITIFGNANWFNGAPFIQKRVRNSVRGSLTLQNMPVFRSSMSDKQNSIVHIA